MKYRLIFAPEFTRDLDEIFEYISCTLSAPLAAENQMAKIDKAITALKTMPYMYPICDELLGELNYRKIAVNNYVIIYSVDENNRCANLLRAFYGKSEYYKFFRVN